MKPDRMLTIIVHEDGIIEVMRPTALADLHIVIVDEVGRWTDSPAAFADADDNAQAEQIAEYRYAGFVDRNP